MSVTICKDDLIEMGYKKYQAISLIREAKAIMVQKGCPYYNNKRLGRVPREVVESILGVSLVLEIGIANEG
jgi:predicted nucleotidyltransferase